jgi:selenocysteine lyase/cysteine desulfurase
MLPSQRDAFRLRISPHVYNDEQDVDRFVEVFSDVMARAPAG